MRYTIFILILGFSFIAHSQFGISPTISFGTSFESHKSFNNFVTSYNDFVSDLPQYKECLSQWGLGRNFEVGLGIAMFGMLIHELNYSNVVHNTNAKFEFDHRRKFRMTQNEFNYVASFGGFGDGAQLTFGVGLNVSSSKIRSSYVFSDGYESLGEDGRLNGVYSLLALKPMLAFRFAYPLKPGISITARADWIAPGGIGSKGPEGIFRDFNRGKSFGSAYSYEKLPQQYIPSQTTIPQDAEVVMGDWSEFRLRIGIIFLLVE